MTDGSTARRGALALVPGPHQQLDVERIAIELAECRNVDTLRGVLEHARAIDLYQRKRNASLAAQQDAAEIALRAERRLGELCREVTGGRGGDRRSTNSVLVGPSLAELGITHIDSSRWQKLATLPESRFNDHVATVRTKGERLTTAGVIREIDKAPPEPEPFHALVAAGDFKDAVRARVRALIKDWPDSARSMVPVLLHDLADEIGDEVEDDG